MPPSATSGAPLSTYDQRIKDAAIPDGENLRRLKEIRKLVAKELGPKWVKSMTTSNIPADIVFNLIMPFCGFILIIFHWTPNWYNPLEVLLYVFAAGWINMGAAGCYHDLTHRMPFGYFWTRVLAKLMTPATAMGEYFYKRHQLHHAKTGEVDDPKMRRYNNYHSSSWVRVISMIMPFLILPLELYHQKHAADKFEKKIKINKWIFRVEGLLQLGMIGYLIYVFGGWVAGAKILCIASGGHWFNSMRVLMEHCGQDLSNEWNQSTFYESGIFLRIAFFGVPTADLHHCHHTYPKMPNYKNLLWGHQMNPVIEKMGVKKYTSFWKLWYNFYIAHKEYGTEWH